MRFAQNVAAGKAARFRIYDSSSYDDIAQDALLSVLTSLSRDSVDGLTGGLIANAVAHAMTTAISERTGVHRPENVKALKMLEAQVEAFTHEHGREPSSRERNELARQIRENWPDPRHRPLVGYQARVIHEVLQQSRDALQVRGGVDPADEHDGAGHLKQLDEDVAAGLVTKELARMRLWNAVAKAEGLPLVSRQLPAGTTVMKCVRAVTAGGGAFVVAKGYMETEVRTPHVDALLALFDIRCRQDAIDIARMLVSRGGVAELLWKSATMAASRPGTW